MPLCPPTGVSKPAESLIPAVTPDPAVCPGHLSLGSQGPSAVPFAAVGSLPPRPPELGLSRPPDRLSDSCGSKTDGGALGFTLAELGLVHYRPGPLVNTLRAQIRIKCDARDCENAPLHICKKSGRGKALFCQLEREGEAARKERSCDNS